MRTMLCFERQREPTRCGHLAIVLYLLSAILPHALVTAATLKRDKDALLEFALTADSPSRILEQNWTFRTDPCADAWIGVTCDTDPATAQSFVTMLDLSLKNIVGPISPYLGNLSSLNSLDLSTNSLRGEIPKELGNLRNLTMLYLSQNELSGTIPKSLTDLPSLLHLYLANNRLTGSITTRLPPSIVFLALGWNSFTGAVPSLENLPDLARFTLQHNSLSGGIPVKLANLPALQELDLSANNLSGPIPPEFGKSTQLVNLLLSENALTGPLPEEIFTNLPMLTGLYLFQNNLSGPIPPAIGTNSSSPLSIVNLAENSLTDGIPLGIGNLGMLEKLYLNDNELNGTIPSNLGNLSQLNALDVSHNMLTGVIPPDLGQLPKLREIYLSHNDLTGHIPTSLENIPDLAVLSLSSNSFTGPIPEALGNSVNRSSEIYPLLADFSNNFFNGSIPTSSNWSVPLNCLNLTRGHYYQTGQRDSQVCAQQYQELYCPCDAPKVVGTNGSCYCVTPLTIGVLFSCISYDSIRNFSTNLGDVMRQLAKVAEVAIEQVAPLNFTTNRLRCTVRFSFHVLPLNGTELGEDATAHIVNAFEMSADNKVTVPYFQSGYTFISGENNTAPPPPPSQRRQNPGISAKVVIAIVSSVVLVAAVMATFFLWFIFLRRPARMVIPGSAVRSWKFSELRTATGGFSDANVLGTGGFATVYRGELEGRPVAVKRLTSGNSKRHQELALEVETIGSIHHRNLVDLEGYCIEGDEYILIYTLMPNGSVEDWLFRRAKGDPLSWSCCVNIMKGTANALAYLHSGCDEKIIHRDIKPANILLDETFEAHVADFGLARSTVVEDTHVSTRVVGTMGYLAPEYFQSGQLTEKSDVYSFGIVMLVILSHRKALSMSAGRATQLVNEVCLAVKENNLMGLIAPHFDNYDESEAVRLLHLAILCIQQTHLLRPSMDEVKQILCTNVELPAAQLNKAMSELREATLYVENYDSSFSQTGGSKEKSSGRNSKDKSRGDDSLQTISHTFTQLLSGR